MILHLYKTTFQKSVGTHRHYLNDLKVQQDEDVSQPVLHHYHSTIFQMNPEANKRFICKTYIKSHLEQTKPQLPVFYRKYHTRND